MIQKIMISGLIAAVLAMFGALVVLAIPATEQLIGERVCAPGERLTLRRQIINLRMQRTSFVCQGASGTRNVGLQPFGYAYLLSLLALTPLLMLMGALGQRLGLGFRVKYSHRPVGGTVSGTTGAGVSYVVDDAEVAERIQQIVDRGQPNLQDIGDLISSLGQSGKVTGGYQRDAAKSVGTVAEALRTLQSLLNEGLITREEYDSKRAEILGQAFGGHG
jgi:hypothetical protein